MMLKALRKVLEQESIKLVQITLNSLIVKIGNLMRGQLQHGGYGQVHFLLYGVQGK